MPIFPEIINEQKAASGNYQYWTRIDQFRSYVKIGLSFFAFLRLQMQREFRGNRKKLLSNKFSNAL